MKTIVLQAGRLASVGALASLMLAGCASTGGTGTTDITTLENQIIQATTNACLFVPTISTVAQIITALTGGQDIAVNVGDAATKICNAITSTPTVSARRGAASAPVAVVNGKPIEIHGHFLSASKRGARRR